jgi:hypothetical protein
LRSRDRLLEEGRLDGEAGRRLSGRDCDGWATTRRHDLVTRAMPTDLTHRELLRDRIKQYCRRICATRTYLFVFIA